MACADSHVRKNMKFTTTALAGALLATMSIGMTAPAYAAAGSVVRQPVLQQDDLGGGDGNLDDACNFLPQEEWQEAITEANSCQNGEPPNLSL
jgi:hypothetical protein